MEHKDLSHFLEYAKTVLKLDNVPPIHLDKMPDDVASFGGYSPSTKDIHLRTKNRHVMDAHRSLAHELVHYKQDLEGRLYDGAGETGSDIENEANAVAGVIMRGYGRANPHKFTEKQMVNENRIKQIYKMLMEKDELDEEFYDAMGNPYVDLSLHVDRQKKEVRVTQGLGVGPVFNEETSENSKYSIKSRK